MLKMNSSRPWQMHPEAGAGTERVAGEVGHDMIHLQGLKMKKAS